MRHCSIMASALSPGASCAPLDGHPRCVPTSWCCVASLATTWVPFDGRPYFRFPRENKREDLNKNSVKRVSLLRGCFLLSYIMSSLGPSVGTWRPQPRWQRSVHWPVLGGSLGLRSLLCRGPLEKPRFFLPWHGGSVETSDLGNYVLRMNGDS